jgi:hypothetical protein
MQEDNGPGLHCNWRPNGKIVFDPPIKLQRNIVVLTLDDAIAFMRS